MPTTEGVVRAPSWFGITTDSTHCITATTELVVPRSMPIILLILCPPSLPRAWQCDAGRDSRAIVYLECDYVKLVDTVHNNGRINGLGRPRADSQSEAPADRTIAPRRQQSSIFCSQTLLSELASYYNTVSHL